MKFKKVMLVTFLLLAILTIGVVSASEDVDALSVGDAGDDVVESPVDNDSLEADESGDSLEDASKVTIIVNDEIDSGNDEVGQVQDLSSLKVWGTISVYANGTEVASKYCGGGYSTEKILSKNIIGSFSGTYNIKIVYHSNTDEADYSNEGLVTFNTLIENKGIPAEEFNFTLVSSEVAIGEDNKVLFSYQWPDGTDEWDSLGIDIKGEYERRFNKESDTSKDVTFGDLLMFDPGNFEFTVTYYNSDGYTTKLTNGTFRVTKKFTADDFIEIYDGKSITNPDDYVCNVYDSYGGLNGDVTILANDTSVYSNKFTGTPQSIRINGSTLPDTLKGEYNIKVTYKRAADGKVYSKQATITFGSSEPVIPDTKPWVTFEPTADDITYGQNSVVKVTAYDDYNSMNKTVSGNVLVEILYLDGGKYVTVASSNVAITNGVGSATFSNLNVSEYLVRLNANGTDAYKANVYSGSLTVKKALSRILFYDSVVEIGAGAPYNLTVDFEKATGITAKVDGENVTVNENVVLIPALSFGNHTLEIFTVPDNNHIEVSKEVTLNVTKPRSSIIIDKQIVLYKGESVDVTVTTKDALGFNAAIDGHPEALSVNGNVLTISGLDKGTYSLSVTTIVDDNHVAVTEKATIIVKILTSDIIFSNESIVFDYGSSGSIIADVLNGTIAKAIVVGHSGAVVKIEGNKITVSNLTAGEYSLSVTTKPVQGYAAKIKSVKIIVNPAAEKTNSSIGVSDVVLDYGASKNVVVETVGATGFVAKIDGEDAVVEGNTVVVSGLVPGIHTLTVTTIPDADHYEVTKNATITVNKLTVIISGVKVTTTYGTIKNILVTLKDSNNNPLKNVRFTMVLNKVTYNNRITDANGAGKFCTVPETLAPNTYTAKFTFDGNNICSKSTGYVTVVVKKATPKFTAKAKTFKRTDKTKKYSVTLNVKQKIKVTLTVNKKTYTAYTATKGVATFKLSKLTKKGKYTAVLASKGNAYYNKAKSVKVKITVK